MGTDERLQPPFLARQRESLWRQQAIENAKAQPGITARLIGWKLIALWRPWLSADIYSIKGALFSAAFLIPLFVLGAPPGCGSRERIRECVTC